MAEFGSLWVGGPLKKLQQTCLASFVYFGHNINLFVYDMDMEVPNGIIKRDAREVLPEENIFLVKNTYAAFSDAFRYNMLDKFDLIWVDADTLCLTDDWSFFKDDILFCSEYDNYYVGGVLKLPRNSEITKYLVKQVKLIDADSMFWAEMGPTLLTKAIKKYGYESYCQDMKTLCMITPNEAKKFWQRTGSLEIMNMINSGNSKCASLYNGMLTVFDSVNTNSLPRSSAIEYFYNKYVLNEVF
jgi:hypothetical protein